MGEETARGGKIIRKGQNLVIEVDKEESKYRKRHGIKDILSETVDCSKCGKSMQTQIRKGSEIKLHPVLQVLLCSRCADYYGDGEFSVDEDGEDKYCRWCGEGGGIVYICSKCTCGFCPKCIRRHFGRDAVEKIKEDDAWSCYICKPKELWKLRAVAIAAKEAAKVNEEIEQKRAAGVKKKDLKESNFEDETKFGNPEDEKIKLPPVRRYVRFCRYVKRRTHDATLEANKLISHGKRIRTVSQLKQLSEKLAVIEANFEKLIGECSKERLGFLGLPDDEPKPRVSRKKKRYYEDDEEKPEENNGVEESDSLEESKEVEGNHVQEAVDDRRKTPKKRRSYYNRAENA